MTDYVVTGTFSSQSGQFGFALREQVAGTRRFVGKGGGAPGIDASFVVESDRMKYQFEITPGADPSRIRLRYDGAAGLSLDHGGELRIEAGDHVLTDAAPVGFQIIAGHVRAIHAAYAIGRNGEYGITIGEYDRSQPLTIDPTLVYASYLGGSGADYGNSVAVDAAGNAYVAGTTGSIDFPVTPDAYQATLGAIGDPEFNARLDAFVAKVSADGSRLMYATYLGGTNEDDGNAVAGDADGNAYVAGTTRATDFLTPPDAFQPSSNSYMTAFITKLDPTGSSLVYSTHYGAGTAATGIAIDASRRAYVVGSSYNNFALPGTERGFSGAGPHNGSQTDGFLIRLSADGSAIGYGTCISGSGTDPPRAVAVTATRAFVTGYTTSYDFPTTEGAFDPVGPSPLLRTTDGAMTWQSGGVPESC